MGLISLSGGVSDHTHDGIAPDGACSMSTMNDASANVIINAMKIYFLSIGCSQARDN